MNRFKCTYWASGRQYYGDMECNTIEWARKMWRKMQGFERFEIPPYKVAA